MVKARDAVAAARALTGTPYGEMDCINLIKKIIRTAPGGVKGYTTAGTNALWKSFSASAKYKDLTWRQEGLDGAEAGMLAFKRTGENVHHVGLVTGEGTVVHSSSVLGQVTETPLTQKEGWSLLAIHRHIEAGKGGEEPQEGTMESYRASVRLSDPDSSLRVRDEPGLGGSVIGKLFHGQGVTVQAEFENGWAFIQNSDNGGSGYVSGEYLERMDEETAINETPENVLRVSGVPVIVDGEGNEFFPVGGWHVEFRAND